MFLRFSEQFHKQGFVVLSQEVPNENSAQNGRMWVKGEATVAMVEASGGVHGRGG